MNHSSLEWNQTTFGRFISIKRGYDLTSQERRAGDIPVYGAAGHNGFHDEVKAIAPGIVIGRSGGSFGQAHFVSKDFWPHNTAMYVTDFKGNDPDFVYYLLKILDFSSLNSGSAQPSLNRNFLYPIRISVPKTKEQKSIGRALKQIDKKIALNNKINTELEAMAKLIYDYWFVQFDFPDANGKPYKSSGGKMVYNEALKREIPEGWSVEELNQCVDTILDHRGKTPKKLGGDWTDNDDGIIALSAKLVKGGKLRNLEKANKVDRALFNKWMPEKLKDGDILMTSEAPAGEFYFIHGKTDYCMSQRLFGIRGKQELLAPTYLYYELSKGHGYSQILGSLSGSTVFGIRQDVLRTIKVVVPELALQKRFDEIVLPQLKQIKNLDQANIELSALRDWLLPMLMNGQVTVKDTAS